MKAILLLTSISSNICHSLSLALHRICVDGHAEYQAAGFRHEVVFVYDGQTKKMQARHPALVVCIACGQCDAHATFEIGGRKLFEDFDVFKAQIQSSNA